MYFDGHLRTFIGLSFSTFTFHLLFFSPLGLILSFQMVHVGDKVEVRDSGEKWAVGIVEEISEESGLPTVTKEGWDMGYEWEECRLKVHK
jgi:hypothetical protein